MKNRGVRIYGLTDAPAFPAAARLKKLGLDVYFEGLYTLENYLPPVGPDGDARRSIMTFDITFFISPLPRISSLPMS